MWIRLIDKTGNPLATKESMLEQKRDAFINLIETAKKNNAKFIAIVPTNPPTQLTFGGEHAQMMYDKVAEVVMGLYHQKSL